MHELSSALISIESGVGTDARGRPGKRQVTILTRAGWEAACADLGADLPWTMRRANLFVDGVDLQGKIGYELRVGAAILLINGQTSPCGRMEENRVGLMHALRPEWRGGVVARVIKTGNVTVGCEVVLSRNRLRQYVWFCYQSAKSTVGKAWGALKDATRRSS
jgi:MOSC domain-containing protein YiiM